MNFNDAKLSVSMGAVGRVELQWTLREPERLALQESLDAVMSGSRELRLTLGPPARTGDPDTPGAWTLFLKRRPTGASRLFVAHPERATWVATLALSEAHTRGLLDALNAKTTVNRAAWTSWAEIDGFSNLGLELHFE